MEYEIHPAADIFPMMEPGELDALAKDIKANGLRNPVMRWGGKDGPIIDGRNRLAACKAAGVIPSFQFIHSSVSDDPVAYVLSLNLHRRHLDTSQRAMVAARIANLVLGDNQHSKEGPRKCGPSVTNAAAAKMMNVGTRTVEEARQVQRECTPEVIDKIDKGETTVGRALRAAKGEPAGTPSVAHVSHNSGNNEWYTPGPYIDAARAVMGGIDIDPASCAAANDVVKADRFYTKDDSGLDTDWTGRVWMNPPYASGLIGQFADRLASEVESGNTTDAIILVNNATETVWFTTMASVASALCFPRGRVRFWNPDGESAAPLQGQCILYCGNRTDLFTEEFSAIGLVCLIEAGQ